MGVTDWLPAFLLTLAFEVPIVAWALREQVGVPGAAALGIGAQVLTHPALWFCLPRFAPYALWVFAAETLVTLAEAGWYAAWLHQRGRPSPRRALVLAVATNLTSTLLGLGIAFLVG